MAAPNLYQLDRDERANYRGQEFRSNHTDITRIATTAFSEFWGEGIDTGMFVKSDFNVYGIAYG